MKRVYILLGLTTAAIAFVLSFSRERENEQLKSYLLELNSPAYKWTQVAPPGSGTHQHEWKPGTYPSAVVPVAGFGNDLWMIGQKKSWTSKDGIKWHAFDKHDWGERISMAHISFNNRLWVIGGMDYATNTFLNEIWSSKDGKEWALAANHAEWSPRKGQSLVEFQNKLWLFGGEISVDQHRAPDEFVNDIWASADGIRWTKVIEEAPWKVRGNPQVVVFKEKLWLIGGQGSSDIWNSPDGKVWTKVADESPWQDRYDYGAIAFDNLLWVFAGRERNPRNAYNDVWFSPDGQHWIRQTNEAPWTRRSGNFSVVFDSKLFLYGGKHTGHPDGFSGDIWTMQRDGQNE